MTGRFVEVDLMLPVYNANAMTKCIGGKQHGQDHGRQYL